MKRLVLLALLAACKEPADDFPVYPGGGSGSGNSFKPDASTADDGNRTINGRVCLLLTNPQSLATCAASGAANITVTLGSASAVTADDGTFTLMRPAVTTNLVWFVTGNGIRKSAIAYGQATTLPALDSNTYLDMLASTNATIGAGTGALMMRVTHGGFAVQGATVTAQPSPDSQIYYDGPTEFEWRQDATGTFGVAWVPSLGPGSETLTVTADQIPTMLAPQPVFADTITFLLAAIP